MRFILPLSTIKKHVCAVYLLLCFVLQLNNWSESFAFGRLKDAVHYAVKTRRKIRFWGITLSTIFYVRIMIISRLRHSEFCSLLKLNLFLLLTHPYSCTGQNQTSIRKAGCCFSTYSVSTTESLPAFNYCWSSCSVALVLTCWASAFDLEDTE